MSNYFYLVLLNPIINNKKLYSGINAANYNNITLTLYALRVISVKFLLVISLLNKTEWS